MLTTPDHDDAVSSVPTFAPVGPKPKGFWQDCDSATGQEGTTFRAEEFNEAALNLRAFLADAGVVGVKGKATMLTEALARLYAGTAHSVVATQTLTPDWAGLVVVDATAGNIVLTLPAAAALPHGYQTFQFVRIDTAIANTVRIVPAGSDVIRNGVVLLVAPLVLRSDGVNTWHPLQVSYVVAQPTTLNVSPTGVATPKDPFGGDAFDSLPRVLAFLTRFDLRTAVTINIAAGTYTHTQVVSFGISGAFGQASQIIINGAGTTLTTLQFNGCGGFACYTTLSRISNLTIRGDHTGQFSGLLLRLGTVTYDKIAVRNFGGYGVVCEFAAKLIGAGLLEVSDNGLDGIRLDAASQLAANGQRIDVRNTGAGALANIFIGSDSWLYCDDLATDAGPRCLYVAGGTVATRKLSSHNATIAGSAVYCAMHGTVVATTTSVANDWVLWYDGGYHTFKAEDYGFIKAFAAMQANCRAITSPTINTLGNNQAIVTG